VSAAYVDSSALVAVAFDEPGAGHVRAALRGCNPLFSANLLEAELRSALLRERIDGDPAALLAPISWVLPNRVLAHELRTALAVGHLRGADLWHVACALYLSPDATGLRFVSRDQAQRNIAAKLGFIVLPRR
jgi:hypothetical protein